MAHLQLNPNESLSHSLLNSDYLKSTQIAAMMRHLGSRKIKKCLKNGAGEGIRTLDFHLGNPDNVILSARYLNYPLLSSSSFLIKRSSIRYNRFFRVSIPSAAFVRQQGFPSLLPQEMHHAP
jgi:hypothetical protein